MATTVRIEHAVIREVAKWARRTHRRQPLVIPVVVDA